jgi:hypothetical protein
MTKRIIPRAHGGLRKGAGRKASYPSASRTSVYFDDRLLARIRDEYGDGYRSWVVNEALKQFFRRLDRKKTTKSS